MHFADYHQIDGFRIPQEIENAKLQDVLDILKVPSDYILDVRVIRSPVSSLLIDF